MAAAENKTPLERERPVHGANATTPNPNVSNHSFDSSKSFSPMSLGKLEPSQSKVNVSDVSDRPEGNGEPPRPSGGENGGNANGNANGNASNETRSPIEKTFTSSLRDRIIVHSVKENKNITVLIFTAFSMVGIASTVLFGGSNVAYDAKHGRYGPASLTIWGYGIAIASLTCAWLIKMTTQEDRDEGGSVGIVNIVTIIAISWIIYLNLSNYKKINMKKLPKNYFVVSTWSLYLTLMQYAYFIFTLYPPSDALTKNGMMIALTFIISIIIAFNFALIVIQQIILDNFSVDVL